MTETLTPGAVALVVALVLAAAAIGVAAGWLIAATRTGERWRTAMMEAATRHDTASAADKLRIAELERRIAEQQGMADAVAPLRATLAQLSDQVQQAELARTRAQEELRGQLTSTAQQSLQVAQDVRVESRRLTQALSRSHVRGAWGEEHLDRLLESSGLVRGVNYETQDSRETDEGRQRPDVIVHLAGGRDIVIDAKVPLEHLLQGDLGDGSDFPAEVVSAHAGAVAAHVTTLGSKAYWRRYDRSPEFVVLYLPAEGLLSMALHADPGLLHKAHEKNVILATPTTLYALLRTVAYGWREEAVAQNAREVYAISSELVERLGVMSAHLAKLGRSLGGSVEAFNKTVGTYEGRVQVSARRLADLGVDNPTDVDLRQIETAVRHLNPAS